MAVDRRLRLATANRNVERLAKALIFTSAFAVAVIPAFILSDLFIKGIGGLSLEFLTNPSADAGRSGGILPILVSTLSILAIAIGAALPLSLGSAIYLSEYAKRGGWTGRLVTGSLDILAATPSVVFGLFGNAVFCRIMGLGYCLLAGGLTLACMILPILVRTLEITLRNVPDEYRLAGHSLGLSRIRLATAILIPSAMPGLIAGLVLAIGRVLAETAALLFTSGYVARMPESWFDSGRSLSIHIYDLSMVVTGGEPNAYKSAVVLLVILLLLNIGTLIILKVWENKTR